MSDNAENESRRRFLKAGALTSGALALGLPGGATAQQTETPTAAPPGEGDWRSAVMFADEFHAGAVFRVASPELEGLPQLENQDALGLRSVRVIEYFNTNEEDYLFLPADAQVQEGELYVFDDALAPVADGAGDGLVEVQYRPLGQAGFPFQLEEGEQFELGEGGGEAAVRPSDFFSGALFRVTSGPQGWVPPDVADSGPFTDYATHHASYLGTDDEFLLFPQEDASVEVGRLYVMWEEFEFFDPAGNLVTTEFDVVNEESVTVDDAFL